MSKMEQPTCIPPERRGAGQKPATVPPPISEKNQNTGQARNEHNTDAATSRGDVEQGEYGYSLPDGTKVTFPQIPTTAQKVEQEASPLGKPTAAEKVTPIPLELIPVYQQERRATKQEITLEESGEIGPNGKRQDTELVITTLRDVPRRLTEGLGSEDFFRAVEAGPLEPNIGLREKVRREQEFEKAIKRHLQEIGEGNLKPLMERLSSVRDDKSL